MVRLGNITEIDALYTDREPPAALMKIMTEANVDLFVSGAGERTSPPMK
jgi:DeoR family glycerol-3-phosphate regulon repressor